MFWEQEVATRKCITESGMHLMERKISIKDLACYKRACRFLLFAKQGAKHNQKWENDREKTEAFSHLMSNPLYAISKFLIYNFPLKETETIDNI